MTSTKNLGLFFRKVPDGFPKPGSDLTVEDVGDNPLANSPSDGGLILEILYASFDPYMRGRMRKPEIKSYSPPFTIDEPITNASVARVAKSANEKFKEGDLIKTGLPLQQYVTFKDAEAVEKAGLQKLDTTNGPEDLRHHLGALGMPGLTAYSSLFEIGQPQKGQTIFISSAAGAVGQLVGQLSKHQGLRVIGSVGSDEKLDYLTKTLNFDGGFNYKKEKASDALPRLCPDGIDIYYDNVGGEQLSAALDNMKQHGRIIACGMISQYNSKPEDLYGIKNLMLVVTKRLLMRGFIVGDADFGPKWGKEHQENVRKWLKDGSFTATVHEWGMDQAAEGFVGMLKGENLGKAVLKVKSD